MPDIRSFFGGKGAPAPAPKKAPEQKSEPEKKKRNRKVVDDSDDDEIEVKPAKPEPKTKPKKAQSKEEVKGTETTTSDYFASSKKAKPSKSAGKRTVTSGVEVPTTTAAPMTPKSKTKKATEPPSTGRRSTRQSAQKTYVEPDSDEDVKMIGDEDDAAEDIFGQQYKGRGKENDDYVDGEDDFVETKPKTTPSKAADKNKATKSKPSSQKKPTLPDSDSELDVPVVKSNGRKRKSQDEDNEDDEDFDKPVPKKTAKASPSKPAAKKAKPTKQAEPENSAIQEILDSIPTVEAPEPAPSNGEPAKFDFRAVHNRDPPAGGGNLVIPAGAPNCLAGLNFVFTGIQQNLGRDEGAALVKQYGGKVTTAPSGKTSYVVLGQEAGPKKIETIHRLKLKTIDENGLCELIRKLPANGGDSKAAAAYAEKQAADEKKMLEMAAEIEKAERAAAATTAPKPAINGGGSQNASQTASSAPTDSMLWTTKYAPSSLNMICGNKALVEKLQSWLRNWKSSAKSNFKKGGKEGMGFYRAVMLHGPPGIGKTTAAHLVAKLEGYDVLETNASDTRSKKLVETGFTGVLDTTSLAGYFAGDGKRVDSTKKNIVLVMDEVDGMSAGDRGGVGACAALAKKTRVPMILICNDRKLPKMKPFDHVVFDLSFRRPTVEQIRGRIMTICYREGLKMPKNVLDALIEGTHADIRQIINMISAAKLDQKAMDYDDGKAMSKAWEKNTILKPWDIVGKILSAQMFSPSSTATLNNKAELYFNDHEFSYLMLQENYLNTNPIIANQYSGKERHLKLLELADNAAESISDGDMMDSMIHGSQQQWALMPEHAIFSFVRPASFMAGNLAGRTNFTSWLGNNSKQGKLTRYVKEIQSHMRLRCSGDRHEIRQQYLPALWSKLVKPLQDEGKEAVSDVIDLMDSYFLTRDDWDAIKELGLGPMNEEGVTIEPQTKSTFTRIYNQQSHPLPFMKASAVVATAKATAKEKPDLEDALEASDEEEALAPDEVKKDDEEDLDLTKDKYIKPSKPGKKKAAAKAKKPAAKKAPAKGKKKAAADDDDDDDMDDFVVSDEDEKPKKKAKKTKK